RDICFASKARSYSRGGLACIPTGLCSLRGTAVFRRSTPFRFEGAPARDDRVFPIDFQRRVVAERLDATVDDVRGGHLGALANPEGLASSFFVIFRRVSDERHRPADLQSADGKPGINSLLSRFFELRECQGSVSVQPGRQWQSCHIPKRYPVSLLEEENRH